MRIVIASPSSKTEISEFLDCGEELPRGYEGANFIGTLIYELLRQGHEVIAVTIDTSLPLDKGTLSFRKGAFEWRVIAARKNAYRFNNKYPGRIIDLFHFERRQIIKAIKEANPDIVHAHWTYEFALAALQSGHPHLITIHDNPYQVLRYTKTVHRFLRLLMAEVVLRRAEFVSTVSPYMEDIRKRKNRNYRLIPNPLPMSFRVSSHAKTLGTIPHQHSLVITMVFNGWGKLKNGNVGLQAFKRIQEEFPSAELWLFGTDTGRGGVAEKVCKEMQITQVSFGGAVAHAVLKERLKASTIVLHPSLEESFGVSIIEAMALGIPVIGGFNSGAVPWVINNEHLLADVKNPNEIAKKALRILSDSVLYSKLSNFCIENITTRFSSKMVADEYLEYYKSILKN